MGGPLLSNRRLSLIAGGDELGLQRRKLGLESRCPRLMALGIRFPFKRLSMKEVRLVKVVVGIRPEFFDQLLELDEVRLINFNSSLAVEDTVDDLAVAA